MIFPFRDVLSTGSRVWLMIDHFYPPAMIYLQRLFTARAPYNFLERVKEEERMGAICRGSYRTAAGGLFVLKSDSSVNAASEPLRSGTPETRVGATALAPDIYYPTV